MDTKIFEVGIMACEDVQAWVGQCKFGTGSDDEFVPAVVDDGSFVVLGELCDDDVYTDLKDWNVYHAFAPVSASYNRDEIVVVDISSVSNGVICRNNYKIGNKLVDLQGEAGYAMRYRKMQKGDKFWLGAGCFESVPTVGEYAGLTANKTTLTPNASVPAAFGVKIRASKPMTIGVTVATSGSGDSLVYEQEYLCEVL